MGDKRLEKGLSFDERLAVFLYSRSMFLPYSQALLKWRGMDTDNRSIWISDAHAVRSFFERESK